MKIQEMITNYLKYMEFVRSASPLTLRHYALDLRQAYGPQSSSVFLKEASEDLLLSTARGAFKGWSKLSLASRNRKAATLKSFLGWAFDQGLIERDLAAQIHCPTVPKRIPHFLSVDESLAILRSFDLNQKDQEKVRLLYLIIYGGGLRVSEACGLKWTDITFSRRTLRVRGKGGKERLILLPKLATDALQAWKKSTALQAWDHVFGEKVLNPRTAYEMIRQCGLQAGLLKPLHPHALRHSFATHLLTSGANLRTLQELLGHDSLQATEKYTHLGVDHLARTLEGFHPLGNNKNKKSS